MHVDTVEESQNPLVDTIEITEKNVVPVKADA